MAATRPPGKASGKEYFIHLPAKLTHCNGAVRNDSALLWEPPGGDAWAQPDAQSFVQALLVTSFFFFFLTIRIWKLFVFYIPGKYFFSFIFS